MKKITLISALALLCASGVYAQKACVRVQDTQARVLDVDPNTYVKPLTVELIVDKTKGRIKDEWSMSKEQVEVAMRGNIVDVRSYAVYLSSQKHDADVIVAATFNVRTNDDCTGYLVTVVGYPASFSNWKTAEESDYEWIRMEKIHTTADRDKISAVIKQ